MQCRVQGFCRATRKVALFCVLGLALSLTVSLGGCKEPAPSAKSTVLEIVTANGIHKFDIEVAESEDQKAKGLMFRTSIPAMTGMLFPYDTPEVIRMWMKNTYVSLDMVFIRADGVIHRIVANTVPLSEATISSGAKVSAVLEIAAGEAERLGIKRGDLVRHPHFKTAGQRK